MNKNVYLYAIHPDKSGATVVTPAFTQSDKRGFCYYTTTYAAKMLGVTQSVVSKYCDTDTAIRGCLIRSVEHAGYIKANGKSTSRYAVYDGSGNRIHVPTNAGVIITNESKIEPTTTSFTSFLTGNTLNEIRQVYPPNLPSLRSLQMLVKGDLKFKIIDTKRGLYRNVSVYEYKGLYIQPIIPFNIRNTIVVDAISTGKVCSKHASLTSITDEDMRTTLSFLTSKYAQMPVRISKDSFIKNSQICIYCRRKSMTIDGLVNSIYYGSVYSNTTYTMPREAIANQITDKMLYTYNLNLGCTLYKPVIDDRLKLVQSTKVIMMSYVYESVAHACATFAKQPSTLTAYIQQYNHILENCTFTDEEITEVPSNDNLDNLMYLALEYDK